MDEDLKKIEELERELEELNQKDEDLEDKEFEEEIKKLKEEQENEINSLKSEIAQLKQNNRDNTIINSLKNEIDEKFLKNLEENIIKDIINNKLNNYLISYEKDIDNKINQMKTNINDEYNKIIESHFNEILSEVKNNNEKMKSNYLGKIAKINENINKINQELKTPNKNLNLKNKDNNNEMQEQNLESSNEKLSSSNFSLKDENCSDIQRKKSNKSNKNATIPQKAVSQQSKYNISSISYNSLKDSNNQNENEKQPNNGSEKRIDRINQGPYYNKKKSNKAVNSFKKNEAQLNNLDNNYRSIKKEDDIDNGEIPEERNEKPNITNNGFLNQSKKNKNISNQNHNKNIKQFNFNPKTDQPKKIIQKKKTNNQIQKKYLQILKRTFFQDNYQLYVNNEKINEHDIDQLSKEALNDKMAGENDVEKNTKLFIETRILPLIQKNEIPENTLRIVKDNISIILKCLGLDEKLYVTQYYPKPKKKIDRYASQEAVIKFRHEFGIGEDIIKDNALEDRLIKNDLDFVKTIQDIYD